MVENKRVVENEEGKEALQRSQVEHLAQWAENVEKSQERTAVAVVLEQQAGTAAKSNGKRN